MAALDLVAVAQLVDEAGGLGLGGGVGAAIDPAARGRRRRRGAPSAMPSVRWAQTSLDEGFALLRAPARVELGARVLLGRALVLGDLDEVGAHAEEVAEAAEEHRRRGEADEADAAGRILEDALGGGGDVVAARVGLGEVDVDVLAGRGAGATWRRAAPRRWPSCRRDRRGRRRCRRCRARVSARRMNETRRASLRSSRLAEVEAHEVARAVPDGGVAIAGDARGEREAVPAGQAASRCRRGRSR